MSAHLVEDKNAPHGVEDDMESSFYVVLWTALMFSPSTLADDERTIFISGTFNSPAVNRFGGQGKRGFLNSQKELRDRADLFVGRKPLDLLIRELANLFKYRYYLLTQEEIDLYEKMRADPASQQYAKATNAHKVKESKAKLQNHEAIIAIFARHLASSLWPKNDASQEQPLGQMEEPGDVGPGVIIFTKSTHTLEPVEERNSKRRKTHQVRSLAAQAHDHREVDSGSELPTEPDELPLIEGDSRTTKSYDSIPMSPLTDIPDTP